jgi:hypothetical protein
MSATIITFNELLDTQEKIRRMANLIYRLTANGFGVNIFLEEESGKHKVTPELGLHQLIFEYFLTEFADRVGNTRGIVEMFEY